MFKKNAFSALFFRKQKGTRTIQWQEDVNVIVIIALSSTKPCFGFLKFQFLAKIFGETFIIFVKSTSFSTKMPFISKAKQIKKKLRHDFADERQLMMIIAKQTFPRIYLVPFCSSKLAQIFFSEKIDALRTLVVLNSKCLNSCSYLFP